jgi:hypothetical protein
MDLMAETFAAALLALADKPPEIDGSAAPWLLAALDGRDAVRAPSLSLRPGTLDPSSVTDWSLARR